MLVNDSSKFTDILELKDNEHVLARLIQQHMPKLEKDSMKEKYKTALPFIRNIFLEDLETLLSNREFFMNHINLFLAYYYFYSTTQLTLKINQFEKMDATAPTPVYYNLDWETSNRNRLAATTGFKLVIDNARRLLSYVNTLEHLNFIFETNNLTYVELHKKFLGLDESEQSRILDDLYSWTKEYSNIVIGTDTGVEKKTTLTDAYRQLQTQLSQGVSKETSYRYALAINEIGKEYFLKTRGSLGNTLKM